LVVGVDQVYKEICGKLRVGFVGLGQVFETFQSFLRRFKKNKIICF
jgi:hypothetical protein